MAPTKPNQNLLIQVIKSPPRQFRRYLLHTILSLATINFIVILILHPRDQNDGYINIPSLNLEPPKKKVIGIGSKHFRSTAHQHSQPPECHGVSSNAVLDEWKSGRQTVCSVDSPSTRGWFGNENNTISVEEYVLHSWEYSPTFVVYRNIEGYWGRDILPIPCPSDTTLRHERLGVISQIKPSWLGQPIDNTDQNNTDIQEITTTVIQIKMFDQSNSYERFHAMLNAAMIMRMFDIINPQFVLVCHSEGDVGKMTNATYEMWASMSTLAPIVVDVQSPKPAEERIKRFKHVIHLSSSGTSILVTKSRAFKGRGMDHHCKSVLFRDITQWMSMNYGIELDDSKKNNVTNIVWSSRRPYCCYHTQMIPVRRSWDNEDQFLKMLRAHLGSGYNLTSVDFGKLSARQSIEIASRTDMLVGVHGAGLIWAGFMPIHSGLVEIFGGDRGQENRHYHNVASLADLHYREMSLGFDDPLRWDNGTVRELVRIIQSITSKHEKVEPD